MNLFILIRTAWHALRRNLSRSLLTMLGIIFGVGAVITSMAIGTGAKEAVLKQIESLGSNLVIVTPGNVVTGGVSLGSGSRTTLKLTDVDAIAANIEVAGVTPVSQTNAQLIAGALNWATQVVGASPAWPTVGNWNLSQGRFFTGQEVTEVRKVVVLGSTVAANLFPRQSPLGATVNIRSVPFQVIGVLQSKGQSGGSRDQDDFVAVPITTYQQRLTGQQWVNSIQISAADADDVADTVTAVERLLRLTHRLTATAPDDFTVRNVADVQAVRVATIATQALLLAATAVVSLLVGGIGIMNIMLVSVTERTREIGLRMAVGARGRDIQLQFLIEALTMSCAGGVIGIVIGMGAAVLFALASQWPVAVTPFSVLLGFLSSAVTGVLFGFYPARRAAALDPIEALRYE